MNKVILTGRVVKEPELKLTQNGVEYLQNSIAVQKKFKNEQGETEAVFINFVAWRTFARVIADYFHKGDRIGLVGYWDVRNYTDNNGQNRTANELVVEEVEFLQDKKTSQKQEPTDPFENFKTSDGDLPF